MTVTNEEILMLAEKLSNLRGWKLSTIGQYAMSDPEVFDRLAGNRRVYMDTKLELRNWIKKELRKKTN